MQSMQVEEVPVPELGPNDVLVLVMAAGVNFNGVWAAQGKPVSVFRMHKEPFHIAGSDASGIVWKVGKEVRRWKVGDEVVIHCNQSCGQCPECNGLDPMACSEQKIWGYETSWGSFAQFTKVQAQQLVHKPKQLVAGKRRPRTASPTSPRIACSSGARRSSRATTCSSGAPPAVSASSRMQICKILGANPIAVVSSPDKYDMVKSLGADRRHQPQGLRLRLAPERDARADQEAHGRDQAPRRRAAQADRRQGSRRHLRARRAGDVPRVGVLVQALRQDRHLRRDVAASISQFDVRYLWMRQKEILGSHFANAYQAERANELVMTGKIKPVLDQVFDFTETPLAHQLMKENKHKGKLGIRIQAPNP